MIAPKGAKELETHMKQRKAVLAWKYSCMRIWICYIILYGLLLKTKQFIKERVETHSNDVHPWINRDF